MSRDIEAEIKQNRRDTRLIGSFFREPTPTQTSVMYFSSVEVYVEATVTVYTRPLDGTLVTGHPGEAHGFGRGTFGDGRGQWTQVASESGGELVRGGQVAVADSIVGEHQRGLERCEVGSGSTEAATGDTSLDDGAGIADAFGVVSSNPSVTGVGVLRFAERHADISEYGFYDQDDNLLCRGTLSTVSPADDEEIKIEVELEFSDDTTGSNAVTGLVTLSNSLASMDRKYGIKSIAIGTDGTDPSASDSALGNEVARKNAAGGSEGTLVEVNTIFYRNEPSTQPHDIQELGVFDQDDDLLWRLTFSPAPKDEDTRMKPTTSLEVA